MLGWDGETEGGIQGEGLLGRAGLWEERISEEHEEERDLSD